MEIITELFVYILLVALIFGIPASFVYVLSLLFKK